MGGRGANTTIVKKYKTIDEHRKALSEKYKEYLAYPITKRKTRKWEYGGAGTGYKGIKYEMNFTTHVKGNNLSTMVTANSLDKLEKKIKDEIKRRNK